WAYVMILCGSCVIRFLLALVHPFKMSHRKNNMFSAGSVVIFDFFVLFAYGRATRINEPR
ncbi:MAG: hypothetical protein KDH84_14815, partial [Calditrichaeota bacterium]|nr:hypothetical protein [Calditrichota bacterium]MCB0314510.1 hypothetical protein [Calditrichota bacterium]